MPEIEFDLWCKECGQPLSAEPKQIPYGNVFEVEVCECVSGPLKEAKGAVDELKFALDDALGIGRGALTYFFAHENADDAMVDVA